MTLHVQEQPPKDPESLQCHDPDLLLSQRPNAPHLLSSPQDCKRLTATGTSGWETQGAREIALGRR